MRGWRIERSVRSRDSIGGGVVVCSHLVLRVREGVERNCVQVLLGGTFVSCGGDVIPTLSHLPTSASYLYSTSLQSTAEGF